MDLSKMSPKDKMRYEVSMETKESLLTELEQEIVPEDFADMIYAISRAEYKRGKADGNAESVQEARGMKEKIIKHIEELEEFLECDLYSKFRPEKELNGEVWVRDDSFKDEEDFRKYIRCHFNVLKKLVKITPCSQNLKSAEKKE